jgi:hypothetical protein
MPGFYPQPALLRQGQPCYNGDQQYDQDQTDNVEDYARADHLGYGDHSGAVDDGVLRRAYRHHKAERGTEDRGEGGYQGVKSSGRGYRDHDGHDNSGARRVGGGLVDKDGDNRRDRGDGEQAREAEGVGYAGAEGLCEACVRQQYSERDAASEEDYRPQSIFAASFQFIVKRRSDQFMGRRNRSAAPMIATVPSSSLL